MAELMPGEATARELAKPIAERFKYLDLPDGVLAYIVEAVVDAAHEGLTVAEGLRGNIQPPPNSLCTWLYSWLNRCRKRSQRFGMKSNCISSNS